MSDAPKLYQLQGEYSDKFGTCQVREHRADETKKKADFIRRNEARYLKVSAKLPGVPWFFVGICHVMESDGDFRTHLHNGDPLTARTVQVPKGRPLSGKPPFTWEESAWDAMIAKRLNTWPDWSVAGMLYQFERFNGWGYRYRGLPSPYLWAGSQHYTKGKYVADGIFSPTAVSTQIGAAVILKELCTSGAIALRAELNPASRPKFS